MFFFRNNNNSDTWHQLIESEPENFTVMLLTERGFVALSISF